VGDLGSAVRGEISGLGDVSIRRISGLVAGWEELVLMDEAMAGTRKETGLRV
jgi:hypothetical protein